MRGFLKGFSGAGCYEQCQRLRRPCGVRAELSTMRPTPDPLDPLFERARAIAPPPVGPVAPEVWRRLRAARTAGARPGWWAAIEAAFARTEFAVAFVAACVLLGLFLAEMRVSRLQADRNTQLARSYVRLIDPLLETPPPNGGTSPLEQ
jgi:hypothetical protein